MALKHSDKWVKMPSATTIVARSYPDKIIGIDNKLPWHLRADLRKFRERTNGHAIIMGRKTFESIGKPLPNRINIVLSKEKKEYKGTISVNDPRTALMLADYHSIILGKKEFFIIGGENIYAIFAELINKVFLTEVFCGPINGDAKFETEFNNKEWWSSSEIDFPRTDYDEFPFRITCWLRRKQFHRRRLKVELMRYDEQVLSLIETYESLVGEVTGHEIETEQFELL